MLLLSSEINDRLRAYSIRKIIATIPPSSIPIISQSFQLLVLWMSDFSLVSAEEMLAVVLSTSFSVSSSSFICRSVSSPMACCPCLMFCTIPPIWSKASSCSSGGRKVTAEHVLTHGA
eukprot:TRINITY_DN11411_c0_g1_i13.p1 TRINITY_DN11411_c0_g1~~TRINITY_DN11411_c0_g1_i13.p1  ORF type:complete len:118 (+),score=6.48 TRINITY_DN11411_c0_g1_i13:140-493(+)